MKYNIDFEPHCHSSFSDGQPSLEQNVVQAIQKGLKKIAITDHGPLHMISGVRGKKLDRYLKIIKDLKKSYQSDINVLVGLEFNLLDIDGNIDMPDGYENEFDWIVMGVHKLVKFSNFSSARALFYDQYAKNIRKRQNAITMATTAYINAIHKNKIHMLSHLGFVAKVDVSPIAHACEKSDTLIEINEKHTEFDTYSAQKLLETNARFIVGSDAHKLKSIGNYIKAIDFIEKNKIPLDRVINIK